MLIKEIKFKKSLKYLNLEVFISFFLLSKMINLLLKIILIKSFKLKELIKLKIQLTFLNYLLHLIIFIILFLLIKPYFKMNKISLTQTK
jgi:hypothetical protein